jgi:ribose 5-phosphate isomerase A
MTDLENLKRQAAELAVEQIQSGMVVGLGTGSTAVHVLRRIAALLAEGTLTDIVGIPTSEATAREAEKGGVPLGTLDDYPVIDIAIDGADEIDPGLNLIKGLGGALLHEKIVARAARCFIVVADDRKRVERLGTQSPVPVEVIPFARRPVADYISSLGADVVVRQANGRPFTTDEGNIILDCRFDPLEDPPATAALIKSRTGVVEHGLFLGIASEAIVASAEGVVHLKRASFSS